jgi:transposase-like protein
MKQMACAGDFCPNPECEHYGDVAGKTIIGYGKTREGRQRFQCKSCKKTFNERKGTLFYQRKTDEKDILECLALLAEGTRISSISRAKGIKEDTILSFLRQAAHHAGQVEAILLNDYHIKQVQIDGLWTYVGHKKVVTSEEREKTGVNIGVVLP